MAKDNLDGYLPWLIGLGSLAGGLIIGYGVIPQVLKLLNPPKPEPTMNPNPIQQPKDETEQQKRLGPVYMVEAPPESQRVGRLRPKYLHSSAKEGEQIHNPPRVSQRSYRFQMSGKENVVEKPRRRWRVIEE